MSEVESRGKARADADPDEPAVDDAEAAEAEETGDREDSGKSVRIPQATDIKRGSFKPHGLSAQGRPKPRSGTRAAAKHRRNLQIMTGALVVVAGLVVTEVFTGYVGKFVAFVDPPPPPSVKVRGAFGKAPAFSVPKAKPAAKKDVKELIHGSGAAVGKNDFVVMQLVGFKWSSSGGKELLNTYSKGMPVLGQSGRLTGLPALDNEIPGRRAGSRIQLTLPYSAVGAQIAGQLQLARTDDFVVTADVVATFGKTAMAQGTPQKVTGKNLPTVTAGAAGQPPTIKIPSAPQPSKLQTETLIKGAGPVVAKGKTLVVQYHGELWRNGKVFDSTWQRGAPTAFPIGVGQVIPGWDKGLVGQNVGSRVLLVVPPKEGYGSKGSQDGQIKGTDTLVFVVDILGSY